MRTLEEIKADVTIATSKNDAQAMLRLAGELDELATPEATAGAHNVRGRSCHITGDYRAALDHFNAALALCHELGDHNGVARVTSNIGSVYRNTGDYPAALAHFNSALAMHHELGDRQGVANVTANIGAVCSDTDDYSAALEHYSSALEVHHELGNRRGVAIVTGNIGNVYKSTGDYEAALEHFNSALALRHELGDRRGVASVTANIGNVYQSTGDYQAALEHYKSALALHHELGNRSGVALATGNIGLVYDSTGDYPAALEYYNSALALHQELGERSGVARVTGNIGIVYVGTGDYPAALEHYNNALVLYKELGESNGVALVTDNIGNVYYYTGDYPAALEHYNNALALHHMLGDRSGVARVTGNILQVLLSTNDVDGARQTLAALDELPVHSPGTAVVREVGRAKLHVLEGDMQAAHATLVNALDLAIASGMRQHQAEVCKELRDLAQQRNDFAAYIEHNNEFTRINEEIRGKEATTKLAMQAKEREIAEKDKEHAKQIAVLHSTLPKHIADRVARGEVVNDHYNSAAVLFLDIVGFTTLSSQMDAAEVVALLDRVFGACDAVISRHGLVKIKTIGDSYMAVAFENVQHAAQAALDLVTTVTEVHVRIGIHCGPVVAGVLGKERMQYDVWGDTVNTASRMESSSLPGRIHISEAFAIELGINTEYRIQNSMIESENSESSDSSLLTSHLTSHSSLLTSHLTSHSSLVTSHFTHSSLVTLLRGEIYIKGKGLMTTYWLERA